MKINYERNPKILNEFVKYLQTMNYSLESIRKYNSNLLMFFEFYKEYSKILTDVTMFNEFILSGVKKADILAYLTYLSQHLDNSPKTRQFKLTCIRSFYKWLFNRNPIFKNKVNPTKDIPNIERIVRLPKYLNLEQSKKIVKIFTLENCIYPLRNNTILFMFLNTGLRVSELVGLNIKDVNLKDKYIRVIGKGNKERTVYINDATKKPRPREGARHPGADHGRPPDPDLQHHRRRAGRHPSRLRAQGQGADRLPAAHAARVPRGLHGQRHRPAAAGGYGRALARGRRVVRRDGRHGPRLGLGLRRAQAPSLCHVRQGGLRGGALHGGRLLRPLHGPHAGDRAEHAHHRAAHRQHSPGGVPAEDEARDPHSRGQLLHGRRGEPRRIRRLHREPRRQVSLPHEVPFDGAAARVVHGDRRAGSEDRRPDRHRRYGRLRRSGH